MSDSGVVSVSRGSIIIMTSGGSYSSQLIGAERLPLLPAAGGFSWPLVTRISLTSVLSSTSTISRSRDSRRGDGAERLG